MRERTRNSIALTLVPLMLVSMFALVQETSAPTTSNMLISIFGSPILTENALMTGRIDINDWPLSANFIAGQVGNPAITMAPYSAIDDFQIEMNNQWWPTGPEDPTHALVGPRNVFFDPTNPRHIAAWHFRRAIAHLVNKPMYVSGMGYQKETEVPVPSLQGFTNYATLSNATAMAERAANPSASSGYIYEYDLQAAAKEFELGGFEDYNFDQYIEWRDPGPDGTYGTGDEGPIEPLPNMKLWVLLQTYPPWIAIASDLYFQMTVGLPVGWRLRPADGVAATNDPGVDFLPAPEQVTYNNVAIGYNYNFYVGQSWVLDADLGFIFDLYHSSMGQFAYALNYPGFKNHEFDVFAEKVKYATAGLTFDAIQAQWVKAKYIPVIELWTSKGVKGYRTGWEETVNNVGYGKDNQFCFNLMNWIDGPGTSRSGPFNTIVYGLSNEPRDLNVITAGDAWPEISVAHNWWQVFSAKVLSLIYDSLIGRNTYDLTENVGWLASSWSLTSAYPGWVGMSVAEFTVRTGAMFHDGTPVTPADVAFSLLMVRDLGAGNAWNYPAAMDISRVEINGQTVRVFFNVESLSALHWAGFMPIINKDLWWQAIGDGSAADYNSGFIADDTDGTYTGGTFGNPAAIREYHPWTDDIYTPGISTPGTPHPDGTLDIAQDGSGPWKFVSYVAGQTVSLTAHAGFYITVTRKGRMWVAVNGVQLDFNSTTYKQVQISDYPVDVFHEAGNVNYPGGYGATMGWYTADNRVDAVTDLMLIQVSMPSWAGPKPWPNANWGNGERQYNPDADINGDGAVDYLDFLHASQALNRKMG